MYVNPNQSRNWMKNCKTWPKYQENWVKTHSYKHKLTLIMVRALTCYPPLSCSNWVKVWVSLHLVVDLCSNDQEKITTSNPTFSLTSELSNQCCICHRISIGRAKSDNRFNDSEAKWGHERTILTISDYLYLIQLILGRPSAGRDTLLLDSWRAHF